MFCKKRGQQISDAGMKDPFVSENSSAQILPQSKKKNSVIWLSVGVLLLLIAVAGIVSAVRGKGGRKEWKHQLDLGNRYFAERDYNKAVAAFEKVIQIDPNIIDAYRGLAEVYVAMEDYGSAIAVLERGIDQTGTKELEYCLEELKAKQARPEEDHYNGEGNIEEISDNTTDQTDNLHQQQAQIETVFIPWSEAGLEDHVMDWKDVNMEAAMRQITGIKDRDIMLSDIWELTEIVADWFGIIDISALRGLTNLTHLDLDDTFVSDISPLDNLTNLTYLSVATGEISDISALKNLTNLTHLTLYYNNISDISVLGGLTNLTELELYRNNISDISALCALKNLIELDLQDNPITDYSPVSFVQTLYY